MAGDGGLNALSLLPENVLPQWQQKIANAENTANPYCLGPYGFSARSAIFCRYWTCSFSGRNNQAIGAEVVCHFHLLSIFLYRIDNIENRVKMAASLAYTFFKHELS